MRTNKLWCTPEVTLDDLQSTMSRLDPLIEKYRAAVGKMNGDYIITQSTPSVWCVTERVPRAGTTRESGGVAVYKYTYGWRCECNENWQLDKECVHINLVKGGRTNGN